MKLWATKRRYVGSLAWDTWKRIMRLGGSLINLRLIIYTDIYFFLTTYVCLTGQTVAI